MTEHPAVRLVTIAVAMTIFAFSGCIYIPTPEHALGHGNRAILSQKAVESMQPLRTTRADVLLALGLPTERLKDDRYFAYEGKKIQGYILWGVAPGVGGVGAHGEFHLLCFEFADNNKVLRVAQFESGRFGDAEKARAQMREWMSAGSQPAADQPDSDLSRAKD